jgi:hypothetical protein
MNSSAWVDPRIERVRIDQVRAYLLVHGWQRKPYPRPELLVFGEQYDDEGQEIVLTLPSSERMRDYLMYVGDLVAALAKLNRRNAVDVLNEILAIEPTNGAAPASANGAGTATGSTEEKAKTN